MCVLAFMAGSQQLRDDRGITFSASCHSVIIRTNMALKKKKKKKGLHTHLERNKSTAKNTSGNKKNGIKPTSAMTRNA